MCSLLVFVLAPAASDGQTPGARPAALDPDRSISQYLRTVWQRAKGLPQNTVLDVLQTRDGYLWATTQDGLVRFDGVRTARDGTVWIGTSKGLVSSRGNRFATLTTRDGLAGDFVRAIFEDAAGTLWVGTQEGGLSRIVGGRIDSLGTADGFTSNDVRAFASDSEGDLWIGTNVGGLVRLKDPKAVTFGQPEGLPHDVVLPVAADRGGVLWAGTYGGGVARLRNGTWTSLSMRDGLWNDVILSLAPSADGGMWVGTRFGVNHILDGRVRRLGGEVGLPEAGVTALLEDRTGTLWVGTRAGVFRYDGTRAARPLPAADPGSHPILAIHEARDGTLWFGTEGAGAATLSNGRLTRVGGLPNAVIWTISEDQEGAVWLGTNGGGVVRSRDGRLTTYRARDGLIDDTVYRVIDDGSGSLWFSSNVGIQRISRDQFAAFDARQTQRLSGELLGEVDGLRSSECNGGVQPAGWRTDDGILWFPTIKGLVRIDPAALALTRRPPPVVVESVVADGRETAPGLWQSLEPGVRTLEFRYTALSLASPDNVQFRYRLEGFDTDWIDGGNRRVAYYTNLALDTYTFRVIAANADGTWNDQGATAVVTLEPYFAQATAFYALCFVTLFLVVFGLHRARVSGLQARERDLTRLAEERRWALEALQESEAQFRTLFENVNEGVYRSMPDGRLVLANPSMAQLLGYDSVDDLLRVPARELYVDPDEYARWLTLAKETGEARAVEMRLRRRDGGEVTVLESTRVVRGQAGQPVYFEGTLVDITDRKQLEEQLLQLQRIESIGRLAGSVAHDFNNLLTPILGQTDLLAEDLPADDPRRARIDQIRKMALSARSLIRQLLAFSRRQILKRRVLDLNEVVGHLEDILRRLIGEHIELRLRLADGLAPVRVDSGQLEQVIMNLAVNARDAMPLGGSLTIETRNVAVDEHTAAQRPAVLPGKYVMLAVTDTGRGISSDVRDRLFEPFVTTKRHGTGLGLSTVYGIVTQSGGHITVDSEPGRGASFRVFLPALDEAVAVSAAPSRPSAETEGRTTACCSPTSPCWKSRLRWMPCWTPSGSACRRRIPLHATPEAGHRGAETRSAAILSVALRLCGLC